MRQISLIRTRSNDYGNPLAHADAHRAQRVAPLLYVAIDKARWWTRRAPLAPSGWPMAIAPPFGFTCVGIVGNFQFAQTRPALCEANASFSSIHVHLRDS